ncbi:MAG TPA: ADOP family duplicated permease [Polyangiaceae bacterium]|nr:ADOP family duplicated permease [Polyangiaceae bacterium]
MAVTPDLGAALPAPAAPRRREPALWIWWEEAGGALRSLLGSPRYSLPAVLSIALGIGASTAVFAVLSALVLRPLPFPEEERLVQIGTEREGGESTPGLVAPPFIEDFRALDGVFESIAAWRPLAGHLTGTELAHEFSLMATSLDYFDALAGAPELGRLYSARGPAPDGEDVAVIRHAFWLEAFGGAQVTGKSFVFNGEPKTIIGILPDEQAMPVWADVWIPQRRSVTTEGRYNPGIRAVGRLAPGVNAASAQAKLRAVAQSSQFRDPRGALLGGMLTPLREVLLGARRGSLGLLLSAVLTFLLLACANLAALIGTRASLRQREISVRGALGASRWALLRQAVLEAALLVLVGGALGVALGTVFIERARQQYQDLLANAPPRLDGRVLGAFIALLAVTTLVGTIAPALLTRRVQPMDALRGEGRSSGGRRARRVRELLVALQVAASVTLLIQAGLLVRSVRALLAVDPGFRVEGTVIAQVVAPTIRREPGPEGFFRRREDALRTVRRLYDRLQGLPGARAVCLSTELPFDDMTETHAFEGDTGRPARMIIHHWVSPGCLQTLGIPLLSGRDFTTEESFDQLSAIANRAFAREVLGVEDATGHRFRELPPPDDTGPPPRWYEIIGMVADVMETDLGEQVQPALYVPFFINPTRQGSDSSIGFDVSVQAAGEPEPLLGSLADAIRDTIPDVAVKDVKYARERVVDSLHERTALEGVLTALGISALVLAAIGLFGVTAYAVSERSAEIGIRRALGASRGDVLRMILMETGLVLVLGVALGLLVSWLARGFLQRFLFHVSALDPLTYAAVSIGTFGLGLLAALAPARAAAAVSPSRALAGR